MDPFDGRAAIVTGGASGIGRAIAAALVSRGGRVVVADVRPDAAEAAARGMAGSGSATAAELDVTDAAAFRTLVDRVVGEHGRLDYLFNNAGIAVLGDSRDMELEDWNRTIDVNLRGVVHGIAAAYSRMTIQRRGHIVNTASAAGLLPTPGAAAYTATKHAVVGLSAALRAEGARFGVRVSALCPGFIDTSIKDHAKLLSADREKLLRDFPLRMYSAEYCARKCLRGVERNRPIIVVTPEAHVLWRLYRLWPALVMRLLAISAKRVPVLRQEGS